MGEVVPEMGVKAVGEAGMMLARQFEAKSHLGRDCAERKSTTIHTRPGLCRCLRLPVNSLGR